MWWFGVVAILARGHAAPEEAEQESFSIEPISADAMRKLHRKVDSDRDGKASIQELLQYSIQAREKLAREDVHALMKEMDSVNGDNKLSLAELMRDLEHESMYDHDISAEEEVQFPPEDKFMALETAKFHAADQDKDGFLTTEELPYLFHPHLNEDVLYLATSATLQSRDTDENGELTLQEFCRSSDTGPEREITDHDKEDFERLDVDKNGLVSVKELMKWQSGHHHLDVAMQKLVTIGDKDGDGHLSGPELHEAREELTKTELHDTLLEWTQRMDEL